MKKIKRNCAFLFVLLPCLWCQSATAHGDARIPSGVNVSVEMVTKEASPEVGILAKFTYKNLTSKPIKFLKWGTPFEGRINSDLLRIQHDGQILPYRGLHIKRGPAQEYDYLTIPPDEAKSITVDLLTAYEIDFAGGYLIALRDQGAPDPSSQAQKSSLLSFKLTKDRPITFKRTPTFNNCNDVPRFQSSRQIRLDLSVADAEVIALKARNDLRNTPVSQRANAQRYREWFGPYTINRWDKIQGNFDRIYLAARDQVIRFDCRDNESYYAAVFPSQPYTILIGAAFWTAKRLGTDSKAGIIVHELSHFNIIGGTDDHVYGQSGAKALANSQPNLAVNNADSHEFFAENTPFLSMPSPGSGSDPGVDPDPELPDLAVNMISSTSQNPRISGTIGVTAVVSNIGGSQSASTIAALKLSNDDVISLDDQQLAQVAKPPLDEGASSNVQIDFKAPDEEGQFWIGVCVTPVSDETATTNNCSIALPIVVGRRPIIISPLLLLLLDEEED